MQCFLTISLSRRMRKLTRENIAEAIYNVWLAIKTWPLDSWFKLKVEGFCVSYWGLYLSRIHSRRSSCSRCQRRVPWPGTDISSMPGLIQKHDLEWSAFIRGRSTSARTATPAFYCVWKQKLKKELCWKHLNTDPLCYSYIVFNIIFVLSLCL